MSASAASAMYGPAFGGAAVPAGVHGTPGTTKRLLSMRKCSNDPGCPIMVLGSVVCGVPGGGPRGAIGSATAPITRRGDRGLSWVGPHPSSDGVTGSSNCPSELATTPPLSTPGAVAAAPRLTHARLWVLGCSNHSGTAPDGPLGYGNHSGTTAGASPAEHGRLSRSALADDVGAHAPPYPPVPSARGVPVYAPVSLSYGPDVGPYGPSVYETAVDDDGAAVDCGGA